MGEYKKSSPRSQVLADAKVVARSMGRRNRPGCKTLPAVHFSAISWSMEAPWAGEPSKSCPRRQDFSPRTFLRPMLLGRRGGLEPRRRSSASLPLRPRVHSAGVQAVGLAHDHDLRGISSGHFDLRAWLRTESRRPGASASAVSSEGVGRRTLADRPGNHARQPSPTRSSPDPSAAGTTSRPV